MYHGRIPPDPKGKIERLEKRLIEAKLKYDAAKLVEDKEGISRHGRKVLEIERELNNWRHIIK